MNKNKHIYGEENFEFYILYTELSCYLWRWTFRNRIRLIKISPEYDWA